MLLLSNIKGLYKKTHTLFLPVLGSFIVVAGLTWQFLPRKPHWLFVVIAFLLWMALIALYQFVKIKLERHLIRTNRNPFWLTTKKYWDGVFVLSSLPFLVFFSRSERVSTFYVLTIFLIIFLVTHRIFSYHPDNPSWKKIHQAFFLFVYGILVINTVIQYYIHRYNILDSAKSYDTTIGRAFTISAFWLVVFGLVEWWQNKKNNHFSKIGKAFISLLFLTAILFLSINIGVVYFSGLNINPSIIGQIKGAGGLILSKQTIVILIASLIGITFFVLIQMYTGKIKKQIPAKTWHFYNLTILILAFVSLLFSFKTLLTTPEANIIRSFFRYYSNNSEITRLSPVVLEKLKRFGLSYNVDNPAVAHHDQTFPTTSTIFLPPKFNDNPPNVVIVFLESFSARLTSVYSSLRPNLTPGLEKMAANKNTTVVKNYYNASTPTITGLLAQLCSFLPPTGHQEIEKEKRLSNHHLLCLPKILREQGGYKYSAYITAVEKDFANKDTIFASMGADEVFGTEELARYIKGEPLSWGYSDHQNFNFLWEWMQTSTQPFFLMDSTVDTHPPFTKAKDRVLYGNGKSDVLNMAHTTDDALLQFWNKFIASEFSQNTIVIAVADHAIFPAALGVAHFPEIAGKVNFYDQNTFLIYYPDSLLPKTIDNFSASIDLAPTVLQMLNINAANSFEGRSILSDRASYPNLLGMHELGLYINEAGPDNTRLEKYDTPGNLICGEKDYTTDAKTPLTLCEFLSYYRWKRYMFEQGRFWEQTLLK